MAMTSEAFAVLTHEEQIARIELLGREALREFGVEPISMTSLVHAENTTYRVESPQGTFNLRVCRPGYQSDANVTSEIEFVADLGRAGFPVPVPYQARFVKAVIDEVPEPRNCVLLRWQEGEFSRKGYTLSQVDSLGRLMAKFHEFSLDWRVPAGFDRQHLHSWAFEDVPQTALAARPEKVDLEDFELLKVVDEEARSLLKSLPRDSSYYGLIHSDLHHGNVLFEDDDIHVIDFDDLGYGFWIYDFAAALSFRVKEEGFAETRDALLDAYAQVRPLPPRTEELLPAFIRLRCAGIANWMINRQDNPKIREELGQWVHSLADKIRCA